MYDDKLSPAAASALSAVIQELIVYIYLITDVDIETTAGIRHNYIKTGSVFFLPTAVGV
ncbi:MAG: hypothetical protein KBF74_10380 [Ferruginibacter sp.]|nr:hypothetical protein [Ferruginibacter sp.]